MKNKKGLSPIIATMLLITIVIIIGLIIFLWFRGINEEAITKFEGTNIKLICDEVAFEASFDSLADILYVLNLGNVPIYQVNLEMQGDGQHFTQTLTEAGELWPEFGLTQGGAYSGIINNDIEANKILVIPILVGKSDSGEKPHTCEERHGYEILVEYA